MNDTIAVVFYFSDPWQTVLLLFSFLFLFLSFSLFLFSFASRSVIGLA